MKLGPLKIKEIQRLKAIIEKSETIIRIERLLIEGATKELVKITGPTNNEIN